MDLALSEAAAAVRAADALLITAGAGMGVDSGLPDFRGPEGFWRAYPPLRDRGLRFEQMANPAWFRREPRLAWGFYGHRLQLYSATTPHTGYAILRRWTTRMRRGHFVFTSNVDGHFGRAGFPADRIVECHGSIHHLQCSRASCEQPIWPVPADLRLHVDPTTLRAEGDLPRCRRCGELARPNILMFGDADWREERTAGQECAFETWIQQLAAARLVVIELGAGAAIATVRLMGESVAAKGAATLIRINPEPETHDARIVHVRAAARNALVEIDRRLE